MLPQVCALLVVTAEYGKRETNLAVKGLGTLPEVSMSTAILQRSTDLDLLHSNGVHFTISL